MDASGPTPFLLVFGKWGGLPQASCQAPELSAQAFYVTSTKSTHEGPRHEWKGGTSEGLRVREHHDEGKSPGLGL